MKKKVFLVAIACAMAVMASAQFRIGPTVGLELSNMTMKDKKETYSDDFDTNNSSTWSR